MRYKARKVGNSMSITLPTFVCSNLGIKDGDNMDIKLKGKEIIIKKEEN